MIRIHDKFYMTDEDGSISFILHDDLFYIEDNEDGQVVLGKQDIKDLEWFIANVINKEENNERLNESTNEKE